MEMQGLLLGLGDMIASAFNKVLMAVVEPILKFVFEWILTPIIKLLLKFIAYSAGAVNYVIGSFLLQLIDFVEVIFRALAGMESVTSSGLKLTLSLNGGTGDILIQLIRHPDIQSAFVSMCVVGLFLLVVTTVFQIIKVEYTTEGAKNAKGPIFQKAFKGMANLMLLPMLVIFGIVFANQLLGLLDTATKGSNNGATISGLIFICSATDAHYRSNEDIIAMEGETITGIATEGANYAIAEFIEGLFSGWSDEELASDYKFNIEEVENKFMTQASGHKYYSIKDVSKYYNYAYINYILLLFGSVFALKALFFACFGMINRLYKCAVLFIISPAIIGMTPVNEGGLGKWRTAFIGQVLAAYGTILSLNLFFIIVRVLLSMDIRFTYTGGAAIAGMMTSTMMSSLLKCIFVLAGCLLIEKFSKEIGGYFGADDAMSAGKETSSQVGDLAMKGVGAAAMVYTGVAGAAMKGAKMAGGIASKVGKGVAKSGIGQAVGNSKFGKGVSKFVGSKGKDGKPGSGVLGLSGKAKTGLSNLKSKAGEKFSKTGLGKAAAWMKGGQAAVDAIDVGGLDKAWDDEFDKFSRADEMVSAMEAKGVSGDTVKEKLAKGEKLTDDEQTWSWHNMNRGFAEEHMSKLDGRKDAAKKHIAAEAAAKDKKEEAKIQRKGERGRKALNAMATVYGLGQEFKSKLPGMKYHDQVIKAGASGSKALGDEFEAAHGSVEYMKGKKIQDLVHDAPGVKKFVDAQNALAAREIMKEAGKEMTASINTMAKNVENVMKNLAQTIGNYQDPTMRQQRMDSVYDSIRNSGASMERSTFDSMINNAKGLSGKELDQAIKIDQQQLLKVDFNEKTIKDALDKAAKNGLTPESIRKELQGLFNNLGKEGEANLMRIITDAIAKVGGQIGGK